MRDAGDAADWPPIPLSGTTLLLGPSNVGKTTQTARALERWVDAHGAADVVVLDFGPEVERDGTVLGGRLDRVTDLLDGDHESEPTDRRDVTDRTHVSDPSAGLWYGRIDAHAPRAASSTPAEARALAEANAVAADRLLSRAPAIPRAVFVNDATIALQHPCGDPARLVAYCSIADVAVVNAFESDELGTDDDVSRQERAALAALSAGADRVVRPS
jgi:hypothetical protein